MALSDENILKKVGKTARKRSEIFSEKKFYKDIIDLYQMLIDKHKEK